MTDKQKNIELIGSRTFFFAWLIIGIGATFLYETLFQTLFPLLSPDLTNLNGIGDLLLFVSILVAFLGAGFLQQYVLYRFWNIKIRHWWWITAVGFVAGNYISGSLIQTFIRVFNVQVSISANASAYLMINILTLVIVSVLQALLLKKYLERIWLFVLAVALAGIVALFANGIFGYLSTFLSGVLFSGSTGLALLWLDHITYEKVDDTLIDTDRPSEKLA